MVMLNDLDRYHLVIDVIDRMPSPPGADAQTGTGAATLSTGGDNE